MDLCQNEFRRQLLDILDQISDATFVTIDLEMSGIATRHKNSSNDRSLDLAKPTLQQQYEEVKSAAETYQMLQMGITIVKEEREKDFYIARPYNFNVSPLSSSGVDIGLQRIIRFSSSACDFLLKNGFDFGKVFRAGIPYLSRDEEAELTLENNQRAERTSKIPDLLIKAEDTPALEFYNTTRQTIKNWVEKPKQNFANIGGETEKLSGFQRRLVYQLIRNEFPDLRAFSRCDGDFMQVEKINIEREAEYKVSRLQKFNTKVAKQKGLGWIFEALCGGDLSGIDPLWSYNLEDTEPEKQPDGIALRIKNLNTKLRSKNHVIVGHNIFMDLAFLYKTFIGSLPLLVEDFQDAIHNVFPSIIDTKYLATHGLESTTTRSSLKDLLDPLRKIQNPLILLHQDHRAYGSNFGRDHEAGYDSWMTAELFVKLSASICSSNKLTSPIAASESRSQANSDTSRLNSVGFPSSDNSEASSHEATESLLGPKNTLTAQELSTGSKAQNTLVYSNPYAILEDVEDRERLSETGQASCNQWLPEFSSDFWKIYSNKLRVNAIESGICDLPSR
ncbi:BgTH12-00918 [Blumeria graminis f. sp. triticale]|uniref:Bgt-3095 n=3 Tax=Blumeria graminis TaxID=34373 RepID=A0A381L8B9_BLUGR|nr:hypothetical protein BGT96224_3095 [Blumeria graminis f. sp. tritici 96224]CAD6505427.1 BgTH12-00918 [Blumeria graminis f. sp. triticale]VDB93546.1 Bgt-3095 [Blumeria graminis f. sp. tritici]